MDQSKHQIALKSRRIKKKRDSDTHRGASNTLDFRVILAEMNGCVLHVLNFSIVTQNLGKSQPPEKS